MIRKTIITDMAPKAIGPYSQAVRIGDFVYTSGQLGVAPSTGQMVDGGVEEQTRQALTNAMSVLAAAGTGLENVVKALVFIKDMNDFPKVNEVYASFFRTKPPARSCVEVARLPMDGLVEIEMIAFIPRTGGIKDAGLGGGASGIGTL